MINFVTALFCIGERRDNEFRVEAIIHISLIHASVEKKVILQFVNAGNDSGQ